MRVKWKRAAAIIGCLTIVSGTAHAADCKPLTRVASLDVTENDGGVMHVSVAIDGTPVNMIVDAGSPASVVDTPTASSLQLKTSRMYEGTFVNSGGASFEYFATVHQLKIGPLLVNQKRMLVDPAHFSTDGSVGGVLGGDVLRQYDLEFDFAAHKLNLFLPDHCPGVVYWPATAVAVVPLRVERTGYLIVTVTLDGKTADAIFDTGSAATFLTDTSAQSAFGLTVDSPGAVKEGDDDFVYTFKSLDLNGISMTNVPIVVHYDRSKRRLQAEPETGTRLAAITEDNGITGLTLGMHELRSLHVYLSYNEGRMYVTPADAKPASTQAN